MKIKYTFVNQRVTQDFAGDFSGVIFPPPKGRAGAPSAGCLRHGQTGPPAPALPARPHCSASRHFATQKGSSLRKEGGRARAMGVPSARGLSPAPPAGWVVLLRWRSVRAPPSRRYRSARAPARYFFLCV